MPAPGGGSAAGMADTNSLARSLHDVGLATWFGGSLMGAIGVNGAAAHVDDPRERARVANAGWDRWTPVNLAAIAAHLVGAVQLTRANKGRTFGQRGVAGASVLKAALTGAALVATGYARMIGQRVIDAEPPVRGATEPAMATPPEVAGAQRQLKLLQWLIPALTGAVLVVNARMGEQQRPLEVLTGMARRLAPGR
jgi:hypothetical protein